MIRIALRVALVLGFVAGHAAAQEVTYNFDRDADFSKFFSDKWVDIKSEQQVDHLTAQQITNVINNERPNRGRFKTDTDNANLHIGSQTPLTNQTAAMA